LYNTSGVGKQVRKQAVVQERKKAKIKFKMKLL
jgi:hypothetical protein